MVKIIVFIKDLKSKEAKIEVDSFQTIGYGKKLYANLINTSNSFHWKFGGIELNDDKTFHYYGIEEEDRIISVLKSQKIEICIKTVYDKETKVEVYTFEKIAILKKTVSHLIGSSESFRLKFDGMVLRDDKTFEYYDIEDGDVLIVSTRMVGWRYLNN